MKSPNMVKLWPGNVHTNWYVPGDGAVNVTSPEPPGLINAVLAMTLSSSGDTQSLVGPAVVPSVATASLVPAWTTTKLCWLLADGLSKVIVISDPDFTETLLVSNVNVSPTALTTRATGPTTAGVSCLVSELAPCYPSADSSAPWWT